MIDVAAWRSLKAGHVLLGAWHLRRQPRNAAPAVLLDVGARGGPQNKWRHLARLGRLQLQLVEPEPAEAERLHRRFPAARIIRCALGAQDGEATFHANRDPGLSSLLQAQGPAAGTMAAAFKVPVRRFDSLCATGEAQPADFVKIDVQGGELGVLQGMEGALSRVIGLELESQFAPLYRDQPLFHEIYDWLLVRGFALAAIRPQGLSDGGIVEANFFFIRRPLPADTRSQALAAAWRAVNRIPRHRDYVLRSG